MTFEERLHGWFVNHWTKILGFAQVTIGTLAVSTDIFSPAVLKLLLVANGLLVAWRGFFNSQQVPAP